MIAGYRDKRTREFAAGQRVKAFFGVERTARLQLDRLEAATAVKDLAALPGNRFEALGGDRKGQYSIRINDQWRVCFEWPDGVPGPSNVDCRLPLGGLTVTAIHPGEHLAEELKELGMSAAELARKLDVPTNRITGILNGQRAITGDTALRLAHFFGTSAEFWLNLQSLYELRIAQKKVGRSIEALPRLNHGERVPA
jgi:addiction module HigA family antidote